MTVATRSAYPPGIDDLMPAARDLAIRLDRVPAVNELRRELKIGYDKAKPIFDELSEQARRYDEAVAETASLSDPDVEELLDETAPTEPQVTASAGPAETAARRMPVWPLVLLALPASVAIWSGWVGLGGLTGFGPVDLLPGIWDGARLNTAITLPIGVEAYAAYAMRAWLRAGVPDRARRFAKRSAIFALALGCLGQVAYHLMVAAGWTSAPWPVTTLVACLPVGVVGMGAALAHQIRNGDPA